MKKPDFEQMTNKELAELYKNSREEYVKQRDKQQARQGENALVLGDDSYYKDAWGNMILGTKPRPAPGSFDEDMLIAEERRFTPDKLVDFVNANLSDPEIAALLPEQEHVVIGVYHDYSIAGSFDDNKWHIRAIDTTGNAPEIRFWMPGRYDQDEALAHAQDHIRNLIANSVREIPEAERNFIQRIAANSRELAVGLYLKTRLPSRHEKELSRLVEEIEQTGSNVELLRFMSHPDINDVAAEAVSAVWRWSQPHLDFTPELEEFIQRRTAGTSVLTFALLDKLLKQFHVARQITAVPTVTEAQINELPDDQIARLYDRTRQEVARSRR